MNPTIDLQTILNIINNQDLLAKFALLLLVTLFTLFSIVLSRQIRIMDSIINQVSFSPIFETLASLLVVSSVLLLLFVIFVL